MLEIVFRLKTGNQNNQGWTAMKKKQRKNKGFSLVELIVVIAIIGVMTAVGGYSLTAISSANAKECAKEIEAGLISTRTESYSKDIPTNDEEYLGATVSFYKKTDGIYMEKSFESEEKKIGGSKISLAYKNASGVYVDIGSDKITFSFNRSSGAFQKMRINGTSAFMCKGIQVSSGGKVHTVTCYEHTGKVKFE